jgi:hypothetical protein
MKSGLHGLASIESVFLGTIVDILWNGFFPSLSWHWSPIDYILHAPRMVRYRGLETTPDAGGSCKRSHKIRPNCAETAIPIEQVVASASLLTEDILKRDSHSIHTTCI